MASSGNSSGSRRFGQYSHISNVNENQFIDDFHSQESENQYEEVEQQQQHQQQMEMEQQSQKIPTSDIFKIHFKKIQKEDGNFDVACNYCRRIYKFKQGGGYGTFKRHLESKHPEKMGQSRGQTQITGYGSSTHKSLFMYSDNKSKEEFTKMVAIDHLAFSFGENLGFNNYCKTALNPAYKTIPRNTLKRTLFSLYKKQKKELIQFFTNFNGRVSLCNDIWSDHWQVHSYMGITCHWIDDDFLLQKRILSFRVFDE